MMGQIERVSLQRGGDRARAGAGDREGLPSNQRLSQHARQQARLRSGIRATSLALLAVLAGCASSPPVQYYQLRGAPPAVVQAIKPSATGPWQLARVQVPGYLDRDAILVAQGLAGLAPQIGHRWAEPLREAIPRVLLSDLAQMLGQDRVWGLQLPAGVTPKARWQVEILRFEADEARQHVILHARSTYLPDAGMPSTLVQEFRADTRGTDPDAIVAAHRAALGQLAAAMVQAAGLAR